MNPYEVEARILVNKFWDLHRVYEIGSGDRELNLAVQSSILYIQELIKFGNEMGIREPMMKYNKILEELKKL